MADFDSRAEYVLLADVASGNYRSLAALSKIHSPSCVTAAHSAGYLYADPFGLCRLSPAGQARLRQLNELSQQLKQQAQQQAYQQSNDRRGRVHSWLQFFGGIFLGWLLGGFTPKEFWILIFDFFQNALH